MAPWGPVQTHVFLKQAGSVEILTSFEAKITENWQKNMIFGAHLSDGPAAQPHLVRSAFNIDPMTPGGTFTGQTESGRQIRQSGRLENRPLFYRV